MSDKLALVKEVPYDVEKMFDAIKYYAGPTINEGEGYGLRWQYQNEVIDRQHIKKILLKYKNLKDLMDKGIWTP